MSFLFKIMLILSTLIRTQVMIVINFLRNQPVKTLLTTTKNQQLNSSAEPIAGFQISLWRLFTGGEAMRMPLAARTAQRTESVRLVKRRRAAPGQRREM